MEKDSASRDIVVNVTHVASHELSHFVFPNSDDLERRMRSELFGNEFAFPFQRGKGPEFKKVRIEAEVYDQDKFAFLADNVKPPAFPTEVIRFEVHMDAGDFEDSPRGRRFYVTHANHYVNQLIILINLSLPGFCSSAFCSLECDEFREEGALVTGHANECYFDKLINSGMISYFPVEKVLKWSQSLKGFWNGIPESNVERALSYFSFLFAREKFIGPFELGVWVYGALDAFYADSGTAILEKMKKRTKLVLKERHIDVGAKAINVIYNDRSRTLHGQMRFSANFSDPYDEFQTDRFHTGVYESLPSAIFALIESLRFAADSNSREVSFHEVLALRPASSSWIPATTMFFGCVGAD